MGKRRRGIWNRHRQRYKSGIGKGIEKEKTVTLLGNFITPETVRKVIRKASVVKRGTHLFRWRYFDVNHEGVDYHRGALIPTGLWYLLKRVYVDRDWSIGTTLARFLWEEREIFLMVVGEEELQHAREQQHSLRSHWWWYLSDGSFKIEGFSASPSTLTCFFLVAQKDGFGWKYIYNVKVGNDSNLDMTGTLSDRKIKLLREVEGNQDITANTVWESDRHYIIKRDVNVYSGVTLTIEPGTWVRFDGPYKLNVEGSLQASGGEDKKIIFTSNSESLRLGDWKSISFTGTDNTSSSIVENSVIRFGTTGVSCQGMSSNVSKSSFRDLITGVYCSYSSVQVTQSLFRGLQEGISLQYGSAVVEKSILLSSTQSGIRVERSTLQMVDNAMLRNNTALALNSVPGDFLVKNNVFCQNGMGINLSSTSSYVTIERNLFSENTDYAMYCWGNSAPRVNFNNFERNKFAIYNYNQSGDIHAENNWWGTIVRSEIARKIRDRNTPGAESSLGVVIFEPFLDRRVEDAGIR